MYLLMNNNIQIHRQSHVNTLWKTCSGVWKFWLAWMDIYIFRNAGRFDALIRIFISNYTVK